MRQADRVTDRQNDSMTVWQNSRAAKEPALVFLNLKFRVYNAVSLLAIGVRKRVTRYN